MKNSEMSALMNQQLYVAFLHLQKLLLHYGHFGVLVYAVLRENMLTLDILEGTQCLMSLCKLGAAISGVYVFVNDLFTIHAIKACDVSRPTFYGQTACPTHL